MFELKPCPFCGRDIDDQDPMDTVYPMNREMSLWTVVCNDCNASIIGHSKVEAIEFWNTRA
jgi:Lar family restriction alleviation protein